MVQQTLFGDKVPPGTRSPRTPRSSSLRTRVRSAVKVNKESAEKLKKALPIVQWVIFPVYTG